MKNAIIWIVIIATAGYFGSKMLLHHKIASGVDNAVLAMSPFVNIEYDGVSSTMSGELTVDGLRMTLTGFNDEIRIARLGIDTPSYFSLLALADVAENIGNPDDVIPEYFGFIAEGIETRVDADYLRKTYAERHRGANAEDAESPAAVCTGKYGFSPDALLDLGYKIQVASVSAHFRRGDSDYAVNIASRIDDMWEVDAELTLVGDMVSEFAKGSRYRPRMSAMHIEYEDHSLNQRIKEYCGELGLDENQIMAAQMDALHFFGKDNGVEFDEYVIEPYKEFIAGKSNLLITASPTEPVSISQIALYKPSDVPALLDLSAKAY